MSNKEELRRLAREASPGPWGNTDVSDPTRINSPYDQIAICYRTSRAIANAKFIAAANPSAVLELLDEIERLQKDAARYQFIRSGGAYVEPCDSSLYVAIAQRGKHYSDLRDLDMDIDEAIANQGEVG